MAQDMPPRGGYEPVQYKVRGTPPSRSEKIALYWMAFPSADAGPDMAPADLSSSADVSGRQTGRVSSGGILGKNKGRGKAENIQKENADTHAMG